MTAYPNTALILSAIVLLLLTLVPASVANDSPLTVALEVTSQKYCPADNDLFSVSLTLRAKYKNNSDKTLILDKRIGNAWYQIVVAKTPEDLLAGKYEYHPNIDWMGTVLAQSSGDRNTLLRSDFVILQHGEVFESEIRTGVFVWYRDRNNLSGGIRPGKHVLQFSLPAWNHAGDPTEFQNSWNQFGQVVDGIVKTEPIEFEVPSNPKIEKRCN